MHRILLFFVCFTRLVHAQPLVLCDISQGLNLINRETYSVAQIEMILKSCDVVSPMDPSVLFLHGLLAKKNKQNLVAIAWFEKARAVDPDKSAILLELASMYELTAEPKKAQQLYQQMLFKNPNDRASLLGLARLYRLTGDLNQATALYQKLLLQNINDVDALNGLGWIKASQNDLSAASSFFKRTLTLQEQNSEALLALKKIEQTRLQQLGSSYLCDAGRGLMLLNQQAPLLSQIKAILEHCALNKIENRDTFLLHGLLERKEGVTNKNYSVAMTWLQKAVESAAKNDYTPALELAITYEWAHRSSDAGKIYLRILAEEPENRSALLGQARVLRTLKKFEQARNLYKQLLKKNAKDVDALNGLGWVALEEKNEISVAINYFKDSLSIQYANKDALLGLKNSEEVLLKVHTVKKAKAKAKPPSLCDADKGLVLINQTNPPVNTIQKILSRCDKNTPNTLSTLLLHGLLERYKAKQTQNYDCAIAWFRKASALTGNDAAFIELAVTYEWSEKFRQALCIYQMLLAKNPKNKVALLGMARVLRFSYQLKPSLALYQQLHTRYPNDIEVLSGQGEAYLANYDLDRARQLFNSVLAKNPGNKPVTADLKLLDQTTKNILDISLGDYNVPPKTSYGLNVYYFRNLNATDGLNVLATHNTEQIESGFGAGPALLPNNSLLLGYQRIVPKKYSWQLSYDARQHDNLPFENRFYGATSLFLQRNIEWFGGLRLDFPDLWNTQLFISGFNIYTPLPVNVSVTGFWAFQEIGGYNSSYALDFSKEYNTRLFYDFGLSYLPEQSDSMEVHGRLIFPIFKNQAILAQGQHYFFNNSTFINVGWRSYF